MMTRRHSKEKHGDVDRMYIPFQGVLSNPRHDWKKICLGNKKTAHKIDVDWKKYNVKDYIFSHCSIISSVAMEPNGYHIKPVCSHLVNANGNAWSNEVILATFKTFIGAQNFQEHCQIASQSKGTILDAVLRPFTYTDKFGNSAEVYICDILVATSRNHWELVQDILSGKMGFLSMGCSAAWVQCTKCGQMFNDEEESCDHIKYELLQTFTDEKGITRIVAELCGRSLWDVRQKKWVGDPKSNTFIEASWVSKPAFGGAVVNHLLKPEGMSLSDFEQSNNELENAIMDEMSFQRVAGIYGKIAMQLLREDRQRDKHHQMIDRIISAGL
jgi:hypothetical protein